MTPDDSRGSGTDSDGPDIATKALDVLDAAVDGVHDHLVRPILLVGRVIAFALPIVALIAAILALGVLFLVRILNSYAFGARPWATDLLIGVVFTFAGFLVWSFRHSKGKTGGESR
jgi:hypothetical protein